ncbi:hypothetical protein HYFRA_00005241 [Hymenoscyphus fraxineus]|uniref:Protein kinase domain-containing protein n=1 Tax=Hymenoscyphus fraxineus TaxID=746836 RepID=A0A9N9LDH9_9HELO|nr:hypothetical protein HYFRA_00005241 [Hymenoscyphus fraxineus]
MADSDAQVRLNDQLSRYYKKRIEYNHVTVLAIYWQECSSAGYKDEAAKLGTLMKTFNFHFEYFEIPSSDSQFALCVRLMELLAANRQDNTLLIIHYGGHGWIDDSHDNQSVWAAESHHTAANLRWSDLQRELKKHTSEVLVLLDCCFASQAARGSKSPIPNNVELFAACGMSAKTLAPGPHSFTSLLIQEISESIGSDGSTKVSELHKSMASKYSQLKQSAVYYPLSGPKASITLQPRAGFSDRTPPTPPEAGSVTIRISLSKLEQLNEVVDWLKLNPPSTISNVRIEQLRQSATAVNNFVSGNNTRGNTAVTFSKLPPSAQDDLFSSWSIFNQGVSRMTSYLRMLSSSHKDFDEQEMEEGLAATYAEQLERSFQPVQSSVERSIMAAPELSEKGALLKAAVDPKLAALGLGEMLKLRVLAHFAPDEITMEVNLNSLDSRTSGPFPYRAVEESMPQIGRVLIEAKKFGEYVDTRILQARLQNLAVLLQSSKSVEFHTLSCAGFFFEPSKAYGLIFRVPPAAPGLPISLHDIISKKVEVPTKPTLGQRFQIALKIGTALMKWHLVDWVHQGIASYDIVFFYDPALGVDYGQPYLCGFEYARKHSTPSTSRIVEDFELNVYRHPDRQGVPNASHQKEHDIYSFGVLLLELGLWDIAGKLFSPKKRETISPSEMGQRLAEVANKKLGHYTGTAFQKATSTCLNGDFGVEQDDIINSQLGKNFKVKVLAEIEKATMVD